MALVRVRGCAGDGSLIELSWLADASRRQNGPRKATLCRLITVRFRGKPCPAVGPDVRRSGRRAVVAGQPLRSPQQAIVGSKTRSAGRVSYDRAHVVRGFTTIPEESTWTFP